MIGIKKKKRQRDTTRTVNGGKGKYIALNYPWFCVLSSFWQRMPGGK